MKKILPLIVLIIISTLFISCVPAQYDVLSESNIQYKKVSDEKLELDILYPTNRIYEKNPVLFMFHGGGWISGSRLDMVSDFRILTDKLRESGFIVIPVTYRLLNNDKRYKTCISDCIDAVKWVVENKGTYNIDTKNMGVIGYSAGAHLALMTSYANDNKDFESKYKVDENKFKFKFCIDLSGPTNFSIAQDDFYSEALEFYNYYLFDYDSTTLTEDMKNASPLNYIDKSKKGTSLLIINGVEDDIIPISHANALYEKANISDFDVKLWLMGNLTHQYSQYDISEPIVETFTSINIRIADYILNEIKR